MNSNSQQTHSWGSNSGSEALIKYLESLLDHGFVAPKLPHLSPERITKHESLWMMTSDTRIHESVPYTLRFSSEEETVLAASAEQFIVFGANGHGANSYAIGLVGRVGNLFIAQQEGYGGAYMDNEKQRHLVNAQTRCWNRLVDDLSIEGSKNSQEYFVLYSPFRSLSMVLVKSSEQTSDESTPIKGWRVLHSPADAASFRNEIAHGIEFKDSNHRIAAGYLLELMLITGRGQQVQSKSWDSVEIESSSEIEFQIHGLDAVDRSEIQTTRIHIECMECCQYFNVGNFILLSSKDRQYVLVDNERSITFDSHISRVGQLISGKLSTSALERTKMFLQHFVEESKLNNCSELRIYAEKMNYEPIFDSPETDNLFLIEHHTEMMLRELNYSGGFYLGPPEPFDQICIPVDPIYVELKLEDLGRPITLIANFKKRNWPLQTGEIPISFDRHHSLMVFPSDGLFAEYDMNEYEKLMSGEQLTLEVQAHLAIPMIHLLSEAAVEGGLSIDQIWRVSPENNQKFTKVDLGYLDHECIFAPTLGNLNRTIPNDPEMSVEIRFFSDGGEQGFISEIGFIAVEGRYRLIHGRWKHVTPFEDSLIEGSSSYMVNQSDLDTLTELLNREAITPFELEEFVVDNEDGFCFLDFSKLNAENSQTKKNLIDHLLGRSTEVNRVSIALYEFEVDRDRDQIPYYDDMHRFYLFSDNRDQVILYTPDSDVKIIEEIVSSMEFEGAPRNNAVAWCEWFAGFAEHFTCRQILVKEVDRSPDALHAFIFRTLKDPLYRYLTHYSEVFPPQSI